MNRNFTYEIANAPTQLDAWRAVDKFSDLLRALDIEPANGVYVTERDDSLVGVAGEFDVDCADAGKVASIEALFVAAVRLQLPTEPRLRVRIKGQDSPISTPAEQVGELEFVPGHAGHDCMPGADGECFLMVRNDAGELVSGR